LSFNDLVNSQGELVITLEYDTKTKDMYIDAYVPLPIETKPADIAAAYFTLCDYNTPSLDSFFLSDSFTLDHTPLAPRQTMPTYTILNARTPLTIFAGKKYKPVALKV